MDKRPQKTRGKFLNARITSILSISLVLFVIGMVAFVGIFANELTTLIKENIGFTLVLNEQMKPAEAQKLQQKLQKAPYTKSLAYISQEDALKELTKELGENPEEFLGYNPLQASIDVKLHAAYANNDSIVKIKQQVKAMSPYIADFKYRQDVISLINDNMRRMGIAMAGIAILLLLISFSLINNTVRLSIYSKRFLIHTMKLVGATSGFIRRPFIGSHIVNGIIASFIAMLLLSALLYGIGNEYAGFSQLISSELLLIIFGIILGIGILITAVASFFATNRYLRMRSDDLYLV